MSELSPEGRIFQARKVRRKMPREGLRTLWKGSRLEEGSTLAVAHGGGVWVEKGNLVVLALAVIYVEKFDKAHAHRQVCFTFTEWA